MRLLIFMIATVAMVAGIGALGLTVWAAFTERFKLVCINAALFFVNMGVITLCSYLIEMF